MNEPVNQINRAKPMLLILKTHQLIPQTTANISQTFLSPEISTYMPNTDKSHARRYIIKLTDQNKSTQNIPNKTEPAKIVQKMKMKALSP